MNPNELDRQIQEAQADIAASERQKSATKRLAELLGLKRKREQEQETAEKTRARVEAELLERVHATGAAVDVAIDALVAAENAARAAVADFWAVSQRTESRHSPLSHVLDAALRGYPEGVRVQRYTDHLPSRKGERPACMDYKDTPRVVPARQVPQPPAHDTMGAVRRAAEEATDRRERQERQDAARKFYD